MINYINFRVLEELTRKIFQHYFFWMLTFQVILVP